MKEDKTLMSHNIVSRLKHWWDNDVPYWQEVTIKSILFWGIILALAVWVRR